MISSRIARARCTRRLNRRGELIADWCFLIRKPKSEMKLRTVTLGCKVNQYETEYVREGLLGIGYEDAVADEPAELCIVNTCTVTNEGDAKSRQAIRRLG